MRFLGVVGNYFSVFWGGVREGFGDIFVTCLGYFFGYFWTFQVVLDRCLQVEQPCKIPIKEPTTKPIAIYEQHFFQGLVGALIGGTTLKI